MAEGMLIEGMMKVYARDGISKAVVNIDPTNVLMFEGMYPPYTSIFPECSLKLTECSLKLTECSPNMTECSLKLTD